ncbi:MAG: helix-turn-helix domain-containing protein [Butyricicoccus sp.]
MDARHREKKEHGTWEFPFQIYSAPDAKDSDLVPYHWHPELEIITVLRGEVAITIGDGRYVGLRGDVFMVNSGELHEIRGGVGNLFRSFVFPMDFLQFRREDVTQSEWLGPIEEHSLNFALMAAHGTTAGDEAFAELGRIIEAYERRPPGYQLLIKASLLRIVALFAGAGMIYSSRRDERPDYQRQILRDIVEYLNEHCTEPLRLADVAGRFGLTPQYFCSFFKDHLGRTLIQHINLLRVERASRLLRETDLPIMEVGFQVGFENFSYFIKRFREVFGCTPTEYRKSLRR